MPGSWVRRTLKANEGAVAALKRQDPDLFERLGKGQSPRSATAECADSRVRSSVLTETRPGERFAVIRNAGVIVRPDDRGAGATLQYWLSHLKGDEPRFIEHFIHRKCGAVGAAAAAFKAAETGEHGGHTVEEIIAEHVGHMKPAWDFVSSNKAGIPEEDLVEVFNEANGIAQIANYTLLPGVGVPLKKALDDGRVKIIPYVQGIHEGAHEGRLEHGYPLLEKYGLLQKAMKAFGVNPKHVHLP